MAPLLVVAKVSLSGMCAMLFLTCVCSLLLTSTLDRVDGGLNKYGLFDESPLWHGPYF